MVHHIWIEEAYLNVFEHTWLREIARAGQNGRVQDFCHVLVPDIKKSKGIAVNDHVLCARLLLVAGLIVRPTNIGSVSDWFAGVLSILRCARNLADAQVSSLQFYSFVYLIIAVVDVQLLRQGITFGRPRKIRRRKGAHPEGFGFGKG